MKKIIFSLLFLLNVVTVVGQSVEFVRNGEVVPSGTIVTITSFDPNKYAMDPEIFVVNQGSESVVATLTAIVTEEPVGGFIGYCGFNLSVCAPVNVGRPVSRTTTIGVGQSVNPDIELQGPAKDVSAKVKLELSVDEEVISTIVIKFLRGIYAPHKENQSIIWDQSFPTMIVGDKIKLNARSSSGLPVTYTSNDPSIVEITEDGYLHALTTTEEEVTITALQEGSDYYEAASPVKKYIQVKKGNARIRLSDCVQTYDGETKQVTVVTEPTGLPYTIKYYQGTYEVTDTKNADVYYVEVVVNTDIYEASANTWLIVNKAPQIIVWNQEQTLEEGSELALTANSSSTQEVEYYSETPSVAEVAIKNGQAYLIGKSRGVARIMARVKGDNNHEEDAEVRTFTVEAPVGIDKTISSAISCYPTYVTDCLFVEGVSLGDKIILTNMSGSEVVSGIARNELEKIDCGSLNSGTYLLKVIHNSESVIYKVIKK